MLVPCNQGARLPTIGAFANRWEEKKNGWEKKKGLRGGDWSATGERKKHCGKAESDGGWPQKRKGWGGERKIGQGGDEWGGKEQWLIDIENLSCCKRGVKGFQWSEWDVCRDGVEAAAQLQHHHRCPSEAPEHRKRWWRRQISWPFQSCRD